MTAVISIQKTNNVNAPYLINLTSSEAANPQNIQLVKSILNAVISKLNQENFSEMPTMAVVNNNVEQVPGLIYRTIDFILPGQLGFSLLSAGVFGVAFLFFNLRQQLVLKRFYATPIRRLYIILGEALSRVIFQLMVWDFKKSISSNHGLVLVLSKIRIIIELQKKDGEQRD